MLRTSDKKGNDTEVNQWELQKNTRTNVWSEFSYVWGSNLICLKIEIV